MGGNLGRLPLDADPCCGSAKARPVAELEIAPVPKQELASREAACVDSGPDSMFIAVGVPFRPGVR